MLTRDSRILVGQGREEIHPLVNFAILRNIFGYLDVKSLKSVRQTCTFWNEESNSLLQNRSKITITWYNHHEKGITTLGAFMKYVEFVNPENVFFRNYELHDWRLHSSEEEMTEFWLKCGQHIRNLTLKGNRFAFYGQSHVQNVFFNWTPNMESLRIEEVLFWNDPNIMMTPVKKANSEEETDSDAESDDEDDSTEPEPMTKCEIRENSQPNYNFHTFYMEPSNKYPNFPLEWKELYISYPNLKILSVHPVFHINNGVDNIKELLTDLIEFQEENPDKLQNLKHLDVFYLLNYLGHSTVTNNHFELAMKLKFKLESLRIRSDEVEKMSYDIVGKYIGKSSPSLKTMKIISNGYDEALTIFPPLMGEKISFPKLKDLTIDLNALSSNNMDFLEQTPGLENLILGNIWDVTTKPRLFLNTITMLPLNSLHHLDVKDDILTEDCVRKMGDWFPNLTHFGAVSDDKLLWAVYKYLCNSVEELDIKGKGLTDSGITGMERKMGGFYDKNNDSSEPQPSSSKKSEVQEPPVKRCRLNYMEERTYIGTSIGQMKKLRHITISNSYNPRVRLTDDSVYNGFALLTELTYLGFIVCGELITQEAFQVLCNRRNLTALNTNHFYSKVFGIKYTELLHEEDSLSQEYEI